MKNRTLPFSFLSSNAAYPAWLTYSLCAFFILGWWTWAFFPSTSPSQTTNFPSHLVTTPSILDEISVLDRNALHQALAGDFSLMLDFIIQWEEDAQILIQKGIPTVQRLSSSLYQQAILLGHLIKHAPRETLQELNQKWNVKTIEDDQKNILSLSPHFQRFLPQTYLAASFLLAIAPPEEIVALPHGLRYLTQLYSPEKLAPISRDLQHIHSETLHLMQPHLAFVAPYSHPLILDMLRQQHVQLYSINGLNSFQEIEKTLLNIGHATHHHLEAHFLALFMRACFLAIDNRLEALHHNFFPSSPKRLLYLSYQHHFQLFTSKSLSGQLIQKALTHCPHLSCSIPTSATEWRIPFEQEKIIQAQPEYLFVSIPQHAHSSLNLSLLPSLQHSPQLHIQHIFYLDEIVQEFPSQYVLLGYFDLFQALSTTYFL